MKAAVWYGYKDVRIEDVPEPKLSPDCVKIKVYWAGICGTDRHEYVGPNFIPTEKPHRLTHRTAPLIIGHEFTGIIVEVGANVTGWKVGDRVTANGSLTCKSCEMCKTGRYNICSKLGFLGVGDDGAFAEYVTVEADRLFRIPDNVTLRQGLLAEPIACGIHSTNLINDVQGKDVVVIGPGIIGLGCFFAATLKGASRVLVAGIGDNREALIRRYNGDYVDTQKTDLAEYVKNWSNGKMADIVYECVGVQQTLNNAISISKPGAKIMVMGVFGKKPLISMNDLQEGERVLMTSQAHLNEIETALEYFSYGKIDADELITREVTLDTLVQDGFEELLKNASQHIKVAIKIADSTK